MATDAVDSEVDSIGYSLSGVFVLAVAFLAVASGEATAASLA